MFESKTFSIIVSLFLSIKSLEMSSLQANKIKKENKNQQNNTHKEQSPAYVCPFVVVKVYVFVSFSNYSMSPLILIFLH